jgi:hypothetical protein
MHQKYQSSEIHSAYFFVKPALDLYITTIFIISPYTVKLIRFTLTPVLKKQHEKSVKDPVSQFSTNYFRKSYKPLTQPLHGIYNL